MHIDLCTETTLRNQVCPPAAGAHLIQQEIIYKKKTLPFCQFYINTFLTSATTPAAANLAARVDTASHTLLIVLQSLSVAPLKTSFPSSSFKSLVCEISLQSLSRVYNKF